MIFFSFLSSVSRLLIVISDVFCCLAAACSFSFFNSFFFMWSRESFDHFNASGCISFSALLFDLLLLVYFVLSFVFFFCCTYLMAAAAVAYSVFFVIYVYCLQWITSLDTIQFQPSTVGRISNSIEWKLDLLLRPWRACTTTVVRCVGHQSYSAQCGYYLRSVMRHQLWLWYIFYSFQFPFRAFLLLFSSLRSFIRRGSY